MYCNRFWDPQLNVFFWIVNRKLETLECNIFKISIMKIELVLPWEIVSGEISLSSRTHFTTSCQSICEEKEELRKNKIYFIKIECVVIFHNRSELIFVKSLKENDLWLSRIIITICRRFIVLCIFNLLNCWFYSFCPFEFSS